MQSYKTPFKKSLVGPICVPGSPKHPVGGAGLESGQHHGPLEGPHPHSPGAAQDLDGVRRVVPHEVEGGVRVGQPLVDGRHLPRVQPRVQVSRDVVGDLEEGSKLRKIFVRRYLGISESCFLRHA